MQWQHAIAWIYVVILGGILPFICWGAWAQPGHPHSRPHFVFLMPVIADTPHNAHSGHHAAPGEAEQAGQHTQDLQESDIQGQSLPDLFLLLLGLGILLGMMGFRHRSRYEAVRLVFATLLAQCAPGVPTPPPRPA